MKSISTMKRPLLHVIDGSGYIFRAYYAIRASMTAVDGTPTNAVYGFVRLLLNLLRDRDPGHVAVAFDPSGGDGRTSSAHRSAESWR